MELKGREGKGRLTEEVIELAAMAQIAILEKRGFLAPRAPSVDAGIASCSSQNYGTEKEEEKK